MINDSELLKLAKYKIGIFDPERTITEEQLESVSDITINNKSLSGKERNVDLTEVRKLPNLESLTIANFELQKPQADAISSLQGLEELTIEDSSIDSKINLSKLSVLAVNNSIVKDLDFLPKAKEMSFFLLDVNISQLEKFKDTLESLRIYGGRIIDGNKLEQFEKLRSVEIESTSIDKEILKKLEAKGIEVEYSPERDMSTLYIR